MLHKLVRDEREELVSAHMFEVAIVKGQEPLKHLLQSVFLALKVGLLTSLYAFLVQVHQLSCRLLKELSSVILELGQKIEIHFARVSVLI